MPLPPGARSQIGRSSISGAIIGRACRPLSRHAQTSIRRKPAPFVSLRGPRRTAAGRYLPMQKRPKIAPSSSSALNAPVISPSASWAGAVPRRPARAPRRRRSACTSAAARWRARALQGIDVARAGDEDALGLRLPAGEPSSAGRSASRPAPVAPTRCTAPARQRASGAVGTGVDLLKTCSRRRAPTARRRGARRSAHVARVVLRPRRRGVRSCRKTIASASLDRRPAPRDADALDLVDRFAQPGGVDDVDRHALDLDRLRRPCRGSCPAIGVTIASSAPASALSSELLPTLGWPASTTRMPSRSSAPWRARVEHASSCAAAPRAGRVRRRFSRKSISSSGKSSVASTSMRRSTSCCRERSISAENAPASERAGRARGRLGARIDQVGDGLGLRQVELVVEEGALGELARPCQRRRQPRRQVAARLGGSLEAARHSSCSTTGPPWACSSSTSSPV